ncbi:hypothetical protein [Bordetella petrii]|uniref:hypothetical protein n=1 Tax=Bordetella petrii TaxID=94624 RepID=UPI001E3A8E82|nr:hypothetical protein [Bordetella petrii]MCD0503241.1 hypothetical protein [Bordetella petrii]
MSLPDSEFSALGLAVQAIWKACGQTPPDGPELRRAAVNLRDALAAGRQIPRVLDKTLQPMTGRRHDIEERASAKGD